MGAPGKIVVMLLGTTMTSAVLYCTYIDLHIREGTTMSTIGVRELARRASSIINDIEQKKEPALVTRRGRPVVYMLPVDSAEFEDFVLAHAPQFVDGMAVADLELAAGETVSLANARAELDADAATSDR
jgi:PHD/YefM family antitoxin component YafN of YafNO toxin-antitoxin module